MLISPGGWIDASRSLMRSFTHSPSRSLTDARTQANVDRFEEMVAHEEGIRLGEAGWKERYYKASAAGSNPKS